jgi:hypothetical protein
MHRIVRLACSANERQAATLGAVEPQAATVAPLLASASDTASPMPRVPPVTNAILPSRSPLIGAGSWGLGQFRAKPRKLARTMTLNQEVRRRFPAGARRIRCDKTHRAG